jgi:hypothetical protein
MSFLSFFGHIGHAIASPKTAAEVSTAGAVLSTFNPAVGSLVQMIANAAYAVETSAAAGTPGSDKKDAVKQIVDIAAPVAVQVLSTATGKPADATAIAPEIDSLIDLVVGLFNKLGLFTHANTPAAVAVPAPAVTASGK